MSMLGRIVHYAADAVLLSTVLAGIKRSSGYTVDTSKLSDPTLKGAAEKFLGVGETVFDTTQAAVHQSTWFKKA